MRKEIPEEKLNELDEVYAKAQAFDGYVSKQKLNMVKIKRSMLLSNRISAKHFMEYIALREIVEELESYLK